MSCKKEVPPQKFALFTFSNFSWLTKISKKKVEYWRKYSKRIILFRDLLQQEQTYNDHLKLIIEKYVEPLRKMGSNKMPISFDQMTTIFPTFDVIKGYHAEFLLQLNALYLEWPFIEHIGKPLIDVLSNVFQVYREFAKACPYAKDTLTWCLKTSERFAVFVSDTQNLTKSEGTDISLSSLLASPLSRIQQLNFIIQDLYANTPKDHIDFLDLIQCRKLIRETWKSTNEVLATSQFHSKSQLIEKRLLFADVSLPPLFFFL